jgi:enoyl-CoA hydratase/carnithine racemase
MHQGKSDRREAFMIHIDEAGEVAVVRLAHGKVNALDLELPERITAAFTELDAAAPRAVVFTGAGRAFSAGVDLWRAVARAGRLARQTPPDTFRLTKAQLQTAIRERLARRRPTVDPQVLELWERSVADGRLERYMAAIGSRNGRA